jgi:hypothetical protein
MITKEKLKELLQKNVLEIKFKKIDGSERVMNCSLKQEIIPISENKTPKKVKPENENVLAVWDLEKDAFRSFRVDSVTHYQTITEGYEL